MTTDAPLEELAVVESVTIRYASTFTLAGFAAGETLIRVDDMSRFRENGGRVQIGTTGPVVTYVSAYVDDDGEWLELTDGLPSDIANRTSLYVWPRRPRKEVQVRTIDDPAAGSFPAYVDDPALWADIALAEETGPGQSVYITKRGGVWFVHRLPQTVPAFDAQHIAAGTLKMSSAPDLDDLETTNALAEMARRTNFYGVPLAGGIAVFDDGNGYQLRTDTARGTFEVWRGGELIQRISADHSIIGGLTKLFTRDLAADGIVDLRGQTQHPAGSVVRFLSQVQAPPAPAVGVDWPFVLTTIPPGLSNVSLTYRATTDRFYIIGSTAATAKAHQKLLQLYSIDPAGGPAVLEWSQPLEAATLMFGVARIGSSWFVPVHPTVGIIANDNAVQVRDDTGALLDQWPVTPTDGIQACLGTDGTNVLVAWDYDVGELQTYTTSGTLSGSSLPLDPSPGVSRFLGKGSFDFGTSKIVIGGSAETGAMIFDPTTGDETDDVEWHAAPQWAIPQRVASGMAYNSTDSYWVGLAGDGTLFRYTAAEKFAGWNVTVPYAALVTVRDGSGHETNYDPDAVASFTMEARKEITVTEGAALPAAATEYALYLARVPSPGRTDFHLQGTSVDGTWVIDDPTFTGDPPPADNTFPVGISRTEIDDGTVVQSSDGVGYLYAGLTPPANPNLFWVDTN